MWIRPRSDPPARARRLARDLLAAVAFAAICAAPARAAADDRTPDAPAPDPMDALRQRFRVGMDHYAAGRYADAIVTWDPIYRELGPEAGYRLAFNLGRAWDAAQDPTRAAAYYETYLAEVAARRARDEALEEQVVKQEEAARERLAQLVATRGRIRVVPGAGPTVARVDNGEPRLAGFVAYVAPGTHVVTFGAQGTRAPDARREIVVRAGEIVDVAPPPVPADTPKEPAPRPRPVEGAPAGDTEPFSSTWIFVAGGATLVSAIVPTVAYTNALWTKSEYDGATTPREAKVRLAAEYEDERRLAHGSLAVTSILGATTLGLALAYVFWPAPKRPTATITVGPGAVGVAGVY